MWTWGIQIHTKKVVERFLKSGKARLDYLPPPIITHGLQKGTYKVAPRLYTMQSTQSQGMKSCSVVDELNADSFI